MDLNSFSCSFCSLSFEKIKSLMAHIRCVHVSETLVECQFKNCLRLFPLKSYEKHLSWHEKQASVSCPLPPKKAKRFEPLQSLPKIDNCEDLNSNDPQINPSDNFESSSDTFKVDKVLFFNAVSAAVTNTVANLYSKDTITRAQVQEIIEEMKDLFCGTFFDILEGNVMQALQRSDSKDLNDIRCLFTIMKEMFEDVSTECRRFNHLKGLNAYIKPTQYPVGTANVHESVKGQIVIQPVSLTGTIISPSKTLKSFLELPNVFDQILKYMNDLDKNSDIMENVIQGTLWKDVIKPKFGEKLVFPITMSFDDVATNKDLGSHATVHKLSACHVTISCLPPVFQSVLENLFLVLLFHSTDKEFGMEEVFRPLLDEFKKLEKEGIEVTVNNVTHRVYFALCLIIGDNLGLNTILGFVQGFTANYFCRICKFHKEATYHQVYECRDKFRNEANFDRDVLKNDQVSTGVKSKCIWNELSSFKNTVNVYCDIMHDVAEGVGNYDMAFIIDDFVKKKKYFSYEELNDLVQGFFYGVEFGNKPPLISEDKIADESVGFSASELLCLIRYFPLMIGHKVPKDDKVWEFYLCLREIVELLFAPTFSRSSTPYLNELVAEHHRMYMALSKKNLRPKFHNLTHMGTVIEKIGPLKPVWAMHSESKYKELRLAAHVISSRIKIDYTLSVKSSLKLCARFTTKRGLVRRFSFSPFCEEIPIQHMNGYLNFQHLVPPNEDTWNVVKWVKIDGTLYKPDMVVVVSVDSFFPVFGIIKTISIVEHQQARFLVQKLVSLEFNSHLHSYCVAKDPSWDSWLFVNQKDLVTHTPANMRVFFDGRYYVMLKYAL